MKLPEVIPIFPLPNVVFFPRMPLPLHIFEPRYRAMVRDAARGPRLIGMVLLRSGWEADYEGRPPVFSVGTVGEMVRHEELPDGRFDIVLRGLCEFHVERELARAAYREAAVTWRPSAREPLPAGVREQIVGLVQRFVERVAEPSRSLTAPSVDDEAFVNFFAQHLELPPIERQALLEASTLAERARRLVDVLEFRLEELRVTGRAPTRAQ